MSSVAEDLEECWEILKPHTCYYCGAPARARTPETMGACIMTACLACDPPYVKPDTCEMCHRNDVEISLEGSRTSYDDARRNRGSWLCAECAEQYHREWDDVWAEYYSGLL